MDETPVQYSIDGHDPAPPAGRHTDTDAAAEMEKTRHSLREAAAWKNELLLAKREQAAVHLEAVDAEAARASQAFQQAWENGDGAQMAESQRAIANLEVKRNIAHATAERLEKTQPAPTDPVEAFAEGRSAQAQDWIRSHPDYVMGGRKTAKLQAAHNDAIGEGISPDTADYFSHVNRFLGIDGGGAGSRRRGNDSEIRRVIVTDNPNKPIERGEVRMTKGEYRAATETLVWNHDSPDGKYKKNDPLGVSEYLRRKGIMSKQPGWFDKLSD
jgi:hypothetical protein